MLSAISTQSLKFPGWLINVFLHLINLSQSPIIPWSCNPLVPALRRWGAGTWVWGPPGYKVLSKQTNKIQSFANYIYLIWWLMWFNNNNNTSFSFLLFISPLLPGSSWCRCHQNVCLQNILIQGGVTPMGIALAHRPVHLVPRDSVRRPNHLSPNWLHSPRALSGYLPTPVFAMRWWDLLAEVFISWMRKWADSCYFSSWWVGLGTSHLKTASVCLTLAGSCLTMQVLTSCQGPPEGSRFLSRDPSGEGWAGALGKGCDQEEVEGRGLQGPCEHLWSPVVWAGLAAIQKEGSEQGSPPFPCLKSTQTLITRHCQAYTNTMSTCPEIRGTHSTQLLG